MAEPALLGYWRLGEPSGGLVYDYAPAAPDVQGTIVGSPLLDRPAATNDNEGSMGIDFANYINFGDVHRFAGMTPFAFEVWFDTTPLTDGVFYTIVSKLGTVIAGLDDGYLIWISYDSVNGTRIALERRASGVTDGMTVTVATARIDESSYHHLVVNYDPVGAYGIIFDGTLYGSTSFHGNPIVGTNAPLLLGGNTGGNWFTADVDEFAIYSAPLSVQSAMDHFQAARLGASPYPTMVPLYVGSGDTGSGADSLAILAAQEPGTDSGSGVDLSSLLAALVPTDTGSGSDSLQLLAVFFGSDSGAGTESRTLIAAFPVSDSGSGSELSATLSALLPLTDTGAGSDSSLLIAVLTQSDSGSGSDLGVVAIPIAGSDSGSGSDSGAPVALIPASDIGAGSELSLSIALIPGTESGAGADISSLVAKMVGTDSGAGVDAGVLVVIYAVTDSGSGADDGVRGAAFTGSDSGSGAEVSALLAALSGSQTGIGIEAISVLYMIPATDAGSGSESGTIAFLTSESDSGSGSDVVSSLGFSGYDVGLGMDSSDNMTVGINVNEIPLVTELAVEIVRVTGSDLATGLDMAAKIAGILWPQIVTGRVDHGGGGEIAESTPGEVRRR